MAVVVATAAAKMATIECARWLVSSARHHFAFPTDPLAVPVRIGPKAVSIGQYLKVRRLNGRIESGEVIILSQSPNKGAIFSLRDRDKNKIVVLDMKNIDTENIMTYIRDPRNLVRAKSLLHPSRRGARNLLDKSEFRRGEIVIGMDQQLRFRTGEVLNSNEKQIQILAMQPSGELGTIHWIERNQISRMVLDFELAEKLHLFNSQTSNGLAINPASHDAVPVHIKFANLRPNHYISFSDAENNYIEGIFQSFDAAKDSVKILRWSHLNSGLYSRFETHTITKPESLVMYMEAASSSRVASWLHHTSSQVRQDPVVLSRVQAGDYISFTLEQNSHRIRLSALVKQFFRDRVELAPFSADGSFHHDLWLRQEKLESLTRLLVPL